MSVKATHPSFFSPQILFSNRLRGNIEEGNGTMHMYGGILPVPVSGTLTATDWFPAVDETVPITDSMKSESGTASYITPISRKRLRDDAINFARFQNRQINDLSEIDCFISGHMQKVAMEMEEKRRNHSRRITAAVENIISKKLRGKEEEIDRINKLNLALEEKVKSLCVENQIWKELAHSNEATANALRSNLEQVLAQVQDEQNRCATLMDDEAESCCGSSNGGGRMDHGNRLCIRCGKEEASILFLACRHLCVCEACGRLLEFCPLCNCANNGSIHVVR